MNRISRVFALSLTVSAIVIAALGLQIQAASAQTPVGCKFSIEAEFTKVAEQHQYTIPMRAGEKLRLAGSALGDTLGFSLVILNPVGQAIATSSTNIAEANTSQKPVIESPTLSANGQYTILATNAYIQDFYEWRPRGNYRYAGVGVYTLEITCTGRDGSERDDRAPAPTPNAGDSSAPPILPFTGFGFPGLAPVDFAQVAQIPLTIGTPITGAVTPTGGEILGYVFDGKANAPITLTVTRLSGNLNLGVVVLSEDNKVVYQASFVTSSEMSTTFTLPSDGKYTVGIFRINLISPTTPEPTAFQIQIK